jgi:hypothetical protein
MPDFSAQDIPEGVLIKLKQQSFVIPTAYVDRVIQALYQHVSRAQVKAHLSEHQGLSAEAALKGEL